jgi:predicted GH43/DUF377 family glycosyl hydrolase
LSDAWQKLGLLIEPPAVDWAVSHAALPVVEPLENGLIRVYFAARDERNRARIGSALVDLDGATSAEPSREPELDLGEIGTFDDCGVTTGCLVSDRSRRFLYYSGWSLGVTVPFYFFVGCAVSEDGGPWTRTSRAPMLERDSIDPFLTASPSILIENGVWRMWYVSGAGWTNEQGTPRHWYHVKYAESDDGLTWRRTGRICIPNTADEYAVARPCVIKDEDAYRMWYCSRGDRYRIRYAESKDGLEWEPRPTSIDLSATGWDSQMQAYPVVFDHGGRRHMLYNGNEYGATGIGHAVQVRTT